MKIKVSVTRESTGIGYGYVSKDSGLTKEDIVKPSIIGTYQYILQNINTDSYLKSFHKWFIELQDEWYPIEGEDIMTNLLLKYKSGIYFADIVSVTAEVPSDYYDSRRYK
jgi:hypothetical protein